MEHPIHSFMKVAFEDLKDMIDVNTIVGNSVETNDNTLIIPVSKVAFGYCAGGTEIEYLGKSETKDHPFGAGSVGGVTITPVAFLVVKDGNVKLLHAEKETHIIEKVIDLVPNIMKKVTSTEDEATN